MIVERPFSYPGGFRDGVYSYGSDTVFPTATFNGENYAVDVVFTAQAARHLVGSPLGTGRAVIRSLATGDGTRPEIRVTGSTDFGVAYATLVGKADRAELARHVMMLEADGGFRNLVDLLVQAAVFSLLIIATVMSRDQQRLVKIGFAAAGICFIAGYATLRK